MDPSLATQCLQGALDQMISKARSLSAADLIRQPLGDDTNSVGALVFHCSNVVEFWLGHVALGRESTRDRDTEFVWAGQLAELETAVAAARTQVGNDVEAMAAIGSECPHELRGVLFGAQDDEALLTYVIIELYQHLGHIDITIDALKRLP